MIHVALMGEIVMNPHHPLLRLLLVPKDTQRLIAHKELPMEFVIQWVISFNHISNNIYLPKYLEFLLWKFISECLKKSYP